MPGAARPVTESVVAVPGGRLFVRALGAGPPLIAVHGGPDFDHEYFRPELDVLASAARLVYYDQRGRGRSFTGTVPEVTIASEVADLDSVRAAIGAERVAVLGHSWGALIALEYAWSHPERVARIVLTNPAPVSTGGRDLMRNELAARKTRAEAARTRALRADPDYQNGDLALDAEYYRIHFRPAFRRADQLADLVSRLRRAFSPAGIVAARAIEASLYDETWDRAGYDLLSRLPGIDGPTLVISAVDDFIPSTIAAEIANAIPHADLVVLEGCGHFAFMERPDRVAALVAASVRRG